MEHPKRAAAGGIGFAGGVIALTTLLKRPTAFLQAELLYPPVVNVQPDGSVIISFQVYASGAVGPYAYSATWSDGQPQASPIGYFVRSFPPGATLPNSVLVTIKSADGQKVMIDG